MKICKTCDVEYKGHIRFCPVCGERLVEVEDNTEEKASGAANIFDGVGDELNRLIEEDAYDFSGVHVPVGVDDYEPQSDIEIKPDDIEVDDDIKPRAEESQPPRRERRRKRRKKKRYEKRRAAVPGYKREDHDEAEAEDEPRESDESDFNYSQPEDNSGEEYSDEQIESIADSLDDLTMYSRITSDEAEDSDESDDEAAQFRYTDNPRDEVEFDGDEYDEEHDDFDIETEYDDDEYYYDEYDGDYDEDYDEDEYDEPRRRGKKSGTKKKAKNKKKSRYDDIDEDEEYLRPLYERAGRGRSPLSKFATVLAVLAFLAVLCYGGYRLWNIFDTSDIPTKATVSLTIRSSKDDKPLTNVKVKLLKKQSDAQYHSEYYIEYAEAKTDSLGIFEVEAAKGEYKIEVDSPEYSQRDVYVTVTADLDVEISTDKTSSK